jgi:hypothetical protein
VSEEVVADLPVVQAAGYVKTTTGPIILILNQYAHCRKGTTIHSKGQIEHFGMPVDDKSRENGGQQNFITPCGGKIIHLHYRDGLPKMNMRPPTEDEMATYPHVIITSEMDWDPKILDNEFGPNGMPSSPITVDLPNPHLNDFGKLVGDHVDYVNNCCIRANATAINHSEPDYARLCPYLEWTGLDHVKNKLKNTTQFYRVSVHQPFRRHFKSRFPVANVTRWNEVVTPRLFFQIPQQLMME